MPSTAVSHAAKAVETSKPSLTSRAALVVLLLVAAGFLLAVAGDLNAPFGDSYEGRNGGVWGSGSRAIREDGILDSALGARHESGLVYARHPPLIYPVTATAEAVFGEQPAITRSPSVVAALATIAALFLLLRTIGLRRLSAVAGIAVATSTAMFTAYGPMPDTPMLGLPIGIAVVVSWLRRRQGRGWSPRVEGALAAAAALTAWQAVFVTLVVAVLAALRAAPAADGVAPMRRLRAAGPYLVGTAVGLTLTLLWVIWATGGPGHLVDALSERSGVEGGVDYLGIAGAQLNALLDLFGIAVLGLVAVWFSISRPRYRTVSLLLLTAVFGYAAITPSGASGHDYWLYWAIAPIAVGWALCADAALGTDRSDDFARNGVLAVTAILVLLGWTQSSIAGSAVDEGTEAGVLIADADFPADQETVPTIGVINQLAAWIPYATGVDTGELADQAALERMAATTPDHLVLASDWCGDDDEQVCTPITGAGGSRADHDYELLTAREALARVHTG